MGVFKSKSQAVPTQTTSTQVTSLPPGAKKATEYGFPKALDEIKSGKAFERYQGNTVIGMHDNTKAGLGNNVSHAQGGVQGLGQATDFATSAIQQAGDPTQTQKSLQSVADGDNLDGDPRYMEQLQRGLGLASAQIDDTASSFGRSNSGAHIRVKSEALGNMVKDATFQQYNQERGLQVQAAGAIDSARDQQIGRGGQIAGLLSGLHEAGYSPGDRLMDAGQAYEQQEALELQKKINDFENDKNKGLRQGLAAVSLGMQGLPLGTTVMNGTQVQHVQRASPARQLAGLGLAASSFF